MGLFDLFRKLVQEEEHEEPEHQAEKPEDDDLEIYSGMRVEVSTFRGQVLFVAKLVGLRGNTAQLNQYSESELPPGAENPEPVRVRIRGYNDCERKAVYMEGIISPLPQQKWKVEDLVVARVGNDRAFFRLDTNLEATVTMLTGPNAGEKPGRLLNISVGGACIGSEYRYHEDDKFLLKVQLLKEREMSVMYCQVLRIIDKGEGKFEYGCRFLELSEADQDRITQNIFTVQRQQRNKNLYS